MCLKSEVLADGRRGSAKSKLTQLRPLEHLQLCMRVQKAFDCLNVLLILEPGKDVQVIQRLGQVSVKKNITCKYSTSTPDSSSCPYSGSSYLLPPRRLFSNTLWITSLASESESVCVCWSAPSLSVEAASSSPWGSTRLRCVGGGSGTLIVRSGAARFRNFGYVAWSLSIECIGENNLSKATSSTCICSKVGEVTSSARR